jgi:hypothetical protein
VTIHFLNSVLRLEAPIVSVFVLNPLVGKDRSEDIEVQTRLPLPFPRRLLFYNCRNLLN